MARAERRLARSILGLGASLVLASNPVAAQTATPVVSGAPEAAAVTLYRADLFPAAARQALGGEGVALIVERRAVDLPAGPVAISFRGVGDTLVPQTAQVEGLPAPVKESDFDYALLSPGALIAKSLGQSVHLLRTNTRTGAVSDTAGVLRSGPQGVVLDESGGAVEALHCSGLPERLVFDRAPAGLADQPTLSVRTTALHAGRYVLTLSYLATGFNWSADYVARLAADGKTLDLAGWLTLTNSSATGFSEAPVQVVAGRLARTGDDQPVGPVSERVLPLCWAHQPWWSLMPKRSNAVARIAAAAKISTVSEVIVTGVRRVATATQSELGDYKLYTLPEPTTMAANETKQVRFLDQTGASYRRVYTYRIAQPSRAGVLHIAQQQPSAQITLRLTNETSEGLGKPLPSGQVVVMAPAGDQQVFTGGDRIEDTPTGADLTLTLGRSPLVSVVPEVVSAIRTHGGRESLGFAVTAANASPEPAVIEIRQDGGSTFRVQTEDQPHTLKSGDPCWTVTVPPGGRAVLHYSLALPG